MLAVASPARSVERTPLRTLSYAVELSITDKRDTPGGGIFPTRAGWDVKGKIINGGNPTRGNGEDNAAVNVEAKGAISVDVVEATDDFGLVVDVAEDAPSRAHPKVRVVIGPTGEMVYDLRRDGDLSEEERALVRWLARGFYGEHSLEPGTVWTVDDSSNGATVVEHYRVLSSEPHLVTLDYQLDEKTKGSEGFSGRRTGSLVYDTALIVPVKAEFREDARRMVNGAFDTLRSSFTFALTADSFARKR